jgi:hypothetical protein
MANKSFPTYSSNRRTGDKGVTFIKSIIENQFDWIFRPTHLEDDFGLDGYFDIIGINDSVTGKYLGVQIKTGESYFKNETALGWTYYGENKHLNYFLNLNFPILIILVSLIEQKAYWAEFDIAKTSKTQNGWSIVIPREQVLDKSIKPKLQELTGEVIDYMSQIEYQWEINENIKKALLTVLFVSKEDILAKNVSGFTALLDRLTISDDMITKAKGKITFLIDDYNDDKRQIYEIKEIREWVKLVIPAFKYWGYFLNMDSSIVDIAGLKYLLFCSVNVQTINSNTETGKINVSAELSEILQFLKQLYEWLNEFSDKYSIPQEINKEQSELIYKVLIGDSTFQ